MLAPDTSLLPLLSTIASLRSGGPGSLAVVERTMRAGEMPPLHTHEGEEGFQVVEGTVTFFMGDRTVRVDQGEFVIAPAGVPHTYRAESARVRLLAMAFTASVARYEDFLLASAAPAASGAAGWPSEDELASLQAIAAAAEISVLGPPGAVPERSRQAA